MRENINDLLAFAAVATDQSFTRAAARLGTSQSSLSRTIRKLEERLGVRLLTRTTRSVSPTEAGGRLLQKIGPRLDEIEAELEALGALRDKPAGNVRINCSEYAAESVVWPKLAKVLPAYPDIKVEIFIQHSFADIAAERFDAGVRLGESLEKDMIAVRIAPDDRLIAVGSPSYFERHAPPETPRDLTAHSCINLRLATRGGLYAWEFEKDGASLNVKVEGQVTFNTIRPMVDAALAGFGIAFVPESGLHAHLVSGALVQVLDDWCQPFSGFHLYYPSRRQQSSAFEVVMTALRHRA
ncbi:LysR family transcriptional regulator [Paracoccus stylophorae]|uniref:LysR family transcriptional regulator n=1 Tax=Paracoccus stylophorae TaxID=659350 RepID=A0ABY7SSH1_9RHOB|nr:LysR family transcriptional regulator [Paracoccus stylophorae]WCR09799.1 LysR family transcriptional regulator [Paracoccus stylophorae]